MRSPENPIDTNFVEHPFHALEWMGFSPMLEEGRP